MNIRSRNSLFLLLVLFIQVSYSQEKEHTISDKISDCDGGIEIPREGQFTLKFIGDNGIINDISAYPQLIKDVDETNSIWVFYKVPYDGVLSFSATSKFDNLSATIFVEDEDKGCQAIYDGEARVERVIYGKLGAEAKKENTSIIDSTHLISGEQVIIYFNTTNKEESLLNLDVLFKSASKEGFTKTVNQKLNHNDPTLSIKVRDSETGLPVNAQLVITGSKKYTPMFYGTDFNFSAIERKEMTIMVDAEGYFYSDTDVLLDGDSDLDLEILMYPAYSGQKLEVKGIEFIRGTPKLLPEAESKLKRVLDFMRLNADLKVEISGHVNDEDKNTLLGRILSKRRARKVKRYLIKNGVERKRLKSVGYGNTQMLYPKPKNPEEKQANRRVEVKVLED